MIGGGCVALEGRAPPVPGPVARELRSGEPAVPTTSRVAAPKPITVHVSLESTVMRIAALQRALAPPPPPPPSQSPPPAAPQAGQTFEALLQGQLAGTPDSPAPAPPGSYPNLTGDLDAKPEILQRLQELASRRGEHWTVTSGLRSTADQQRLWDARATNPFPVARPGTSVHESGRAADVTINGRPIQDVVTAAELRSVGLVPLAGDAVHVQLAG